MSRHMSFSMTPEAVRNRTKTVTRRMAWDNLKPDELFTGVEQAMGLKKGEKQVVIAPLCRCLSNTPDPLQHLIDDPEYGRREMAREGFPGMDPAAFVEMFCRANHCDSDTLVNRIEFEYVEGEDA